MVLNCWLARESISPHLLLFRLCFSSLLLLYFSLFTHFHPLFLPSPFLSRVLTLNTWKKIHFCIINEHKSHANSFSTKNISLSPPPRFLFASSPSSLLLSASSLHVLLWNRSGGSVLMKLLWVLICGQLWSLRGRVRLEEEWWRNGWMKVAEGVVKEEGEGWRSRGGWGGFM